MSLLEGFDLLMGNLPLPFGCEKLAKILVEQQGTSRDVCVEMRSQRNVPVDPRFKEQQTRSHVRLRWDLGLNKERLAYFAMPSTGDDLRLMARWCWVERTRVAVDGDQDGRLGGFKNTVMVGCHGLSR
jgi:hypothetical protein